MKLNVKCYSGHKINERPVSFILDGKENYIEEIIDAWIGEKFHYWKVLTESNLRFLLMYNPQEDTWDCDKIE